MEEYKPRYYYITAKDCNDIKKRGAFREFGLEDIKDYLVSRVGLLVINGDSNDIRVECRSKEEYDSFRSALIERYRLKPDVAGGVFGRIMGSEEYMTDESLLESVVFDFDFPMDATERKNMEHDKILIWLNDHLSEGSVDDMRINEDNTISSDGNVGIAGCAFYRLPEYIKFRNVGGNFDVSFCPLLESTAGFPDEIGGDADMRGDASLKDYKWIGCVCGRVLVD